MQMQNSKQEGFVTINSLLVVLIVFLVSVGFMFMLSALRNYSLRLKSKDIVREKAIVLLYDIAEAMNVLKEDDADSPFSPGVRTLEREYIDFQLKIQDVSSGIHVRFMNEAILNNEFINWLVLSEPELHVVNYGWANKNIISQAVKERIYESFFIDNDERLFPLINEYPMTNIHYLSLECITAFLQFYQIENAEKKAIILHERVQNELVTSFKDLLGVNQNHVIFDLIGCKTSFWRVSYVYETCIVEAIFCVIPDQIEPGEINYYKLVERSMRFYKNE